MGSPLEHVRREQPSYRSERPPRCPGESRAMPSAVGPGQVLSLPRFLRTVGRELWRDRGAREVPQDLGRLVSRVVSPHKVCVAASTQSCARPCQANAAERSPVFQAESEAQRAPAARPRSQSWRHACPGESPAPSSSCPAAPRDGVLSSRSLAVRDELGPWAAQGQEQARKGLERRADGHATLSVPVKCSSKICLYTSLDVELTPPKAALQRSPQCPLPSSSSKAVHHEQDAMSLANTSLQSPF